MARYHQVVSIGMAISTSSSCDLDQLCLVPVYSVRIQALVSISTLLLDKFCVFNAELSSAFNLTTYICLRGNAVTDKYQERILCLNGGHDPTSYKGFG